MILVSTKPEYKAESKLCGRDDPSSSKNQTHIVLSKKPNTRYHSNKQAYKKALKPLERNYKIDLHSVLIRDLTGYGHMKEENYKNVLSFNKTWKSKVTSGNKFSYKSMHCAMMGFL